MNEITDITNFESPKGTVITIGTFDGVHLGHQKIIKKIVQNAQLNGWLSTVFTFFPHPRMVVQNDNSIKLIQTPAEKKNVLASLGIDQLITYPFDEHFSRMTAEDFVKDILVNTLKARKIIIGYDHRFGRNRNADINDLRRFGQLYNFEVEEISVQEINDVSVSSTKIRKALESGNVKEAWDYLGRPFSISGKVTHGMKIGRTIGYPTANICVSDSYKLIPADGVYLVYTYIYNQKKYGMMSIGKNPTIAEKGRSIEVYFFDFQEDIYDASLEIFFVSFLREEQKFGSVEELKQQLQKDEIISRKMIENNIF